MRQSNNRAHLGKDKDDDLIHDAYLSNRHSPAHFRFRTQRRNMYVMTPVYAHMHTLKADASDLVVNIIQRHKTSSHQ